MTCSQKCRTQRSKRIQRNEALGDKDRAERSLLSDAVQGHANTTAVVSRAIRDELAPIVRKAITEETVRAISQMVGLTPRAVELMQMDMESDDPLVRQKAYTLVAKYTFGNQAVLPQVPVDQGAKIEVNFALPRPDAPVDNVTEAQVVEEKICDTCDLSKPVTEFVANSDRCTECFEEWRRRITEEFNSR